MTLNVVLYVRRGDRECEETIRWLNESQKNYPHALELRDVDFHPDWAKEAGPRLPAADVNGRRLPTPLTPSEWKSAFTLSRAIDEYKKETAVPAPIRALSNAADRFAGWFSRHWLAAFNTITGLYLGGSFLPPVLLKLGLSAPADWVYKFYSVACHQLGFRSFFLFGEQLVYPRDQFQSISGIDPLNLWAAKAFNGSDILGYKVALCERDVAIYGGILLAGIGFHFVRRRLKPLSTLGWILLGIVPLGLDGGTQLLSYLPYLGDFIPARESTPLLRVLTGLLFGATSVWFAYPYVEESMEQDVSVPPISAPST